MTFRHVTLTACFLLLGLHLAPAAAQTPEERAPAERRAPGERRARDPNRATREPRPDPAQPGVTPSEERRPGGGRRARTQPAGTAVESPATPKEEGGERGSAGTTGTGSGGAAPTTPSPAPAPAPGGTGTEPAPSPDTPVTPGETPATPAESPSVGGTEPGAPAAQDGTAGEPSPGAEAAAPVAPPANGAERAPAEPPRDRSELPQARTEPRRAAGPTAAADGDPLTATRPATSPASEARGRPWPLITQRRAWEQMFERMPPGFDGATPARAYRDALAVFQRVSTEPSVVGRWLEAVGAGVLAGVVALVLFVLAGLVVERRRPPRWRRLWSRARAAGGSSGLSRLLIAVARRALVPASAWLVWNVGGLLAGEAGRAFLLVQQLLTVWLLYRVSDAVLHRLILGGRRREGATGLFAPLHRLLVFAAWWLAGWLAMDATAYREDVRALWVTLGHLILVLGVFGVLARREQVLALLPRLTNRPYQRFLGFVTTAYLPIVYASLVVALLWVAGYQRLAETFLGRGWAVLGAVLVAFIGLHVAQEVALRRLWEDPQRQEAREALLTWTERLLTLVVIAMVLTFSLHVLGLWEPWRYLLDLTWIELGKIRILGRAIWASLWIGVLAVLLSGWLQALLAFRVYPRVGVDLGEAYALNRLLHYAVMAGMILLILNNLGLSPESLALVAGGLSVGIGLGLQDLAGNLASGLILLSSRQIRQGDVITIGEHTGKVKEVNLRSTLVTNWDNVDVLVPNSKLLGDTLVNWTHSDSVIRAIIPFGVAYSANPREVQELALQIAREHPSVLASPEPQVWFEAMGASSLEFKLLFWINMAETAKPVVVTDLQCRLLEELRAREIEIPYPQQDLHLRSGVPWDELIRALGSRDGSAASPAGGNGQTSGKAARTEESATG
ncbi:MAG: mechanosensitive ion channel domain-containing protein [Armatimonadota bacterium]